MKHQKPFLNQQIGHWTVIDPTIDKIKGSYYVLCQCVCGKILKRNYHSILKGYSTSCGCKAVKSLKGIEKWKLENGAPHKKEKGLAAFNNTYNSYKYSAKSRGLSFELNKEEFRSITQQCCFYCGDPPSASGNWNKLNGSYIYTGIDRKNNKHGYVADNCIPCCTKCNFMKKDMDYDTFITIIMKISGNLNEKKKV